jgi:hypothetical protein
MLKMSAAELDAGLKAMALSNDDFEDLAIDVGITAPILREWASGATPIPRRKVEMFVGMFDMHKRGAAVRAAGIPECAWLRSTSAAMTALNAGGKQRKAVAMAKTLKAHRATCPVCRARREFEMKAFGPRRRPSLLRLTLRRIGSRIGLEF